MPPFFACTIKMAPKSYQPTKTHCANQNPTQPTDPNTQTAATPQISAPQTNALPAGTTPSLLPKMPGCSWNGYWVWSVASWASFACAVSLVQHFLIFSLLLPSFPGFFVFFLALALFVCFSLCLLFMLPFHLLVVLGTELATDWAGFSCCLT